MRGAPGAFDLRGRAHHSSANRRLGAVRTFWRRLRFRGRRKVRADRGLRFPSVFGAVLDADRGGHWTLAPTGPGCAWLHTDATGDGPALRRRARPACLWADGVGLAGHEPFLWPTDQLFTSPRGAVEESLVTDSLVVRDDPAATHDGVRGGEGTPCGPLRSG